MQGKRLLLVNIIGVAAIILVTPALAIVSTNGLVCWRKCRAYQDKR